MQNTAIAKVRVCLCPASLISLFCTLSEVPPHKKIMGHTPFFKAFTPYLPHTSPVAFAAIRAAALRSDRVDLSPDGLFPSVVCFSSMCAARRREVYTSLCSLARLRSSIKNSDVGEAWPTISPADRHYFAPVFPDALHVPPLSLCTYPQSYIFLSQKVFAHFHVSLVFCSFPGKNTKFFILIPRGLQRACTTPFPYIAIKISWPNHSFHVHMFLITWYSFLPLYYCLPHNESLCIGMCIT